jgi:hypothetical protein
MPIGRRKSKHKTRRAKLRQRVSKNRRKNRSRRNMRGGARELKLFITSDDTSLIPENKIFKGTPDTVKELESEIKKKLGLTEDIFVLTEDGVQVNNLEDLEDKARVKIVSCSSLLATCKEEKVKLRQGLSGVNELQKQFIALKKQLATSEKALATSEASLATVDEQTRRIMDTKVKEFQDEKTRLEAENTALRAELYELKEVLATSERELAQAENLNAGVGGGGGGGSTWSDSRSRDPNRLRISGRGGVEPAPAGYDSHAVVEAKDRKMINWNR